MISAIFFYLLVTQLCSTINTEKTVCEHKDSTIISNNLFYYQRIELANVVECVERCIENAEYCKAVLFVQNNDQKKVFKNYCQFYSSNSESLGKEIKAKLVSTSGQSSDVYEILENCSLDGVEPTILKDISPSARRALKLFSSLPNENGKKIKSIASSNDLTVEDPLFEQHRNKVHRDERIPVHKSFSTESSAETSLETTKENTFRPTGPEVFHSFSSISVLYKPKRPTHVFMDDSNDNSRTSGSEPVPIQPVVVSRGGFSSSSFAAGSSSSYLNGPCPNGNCGGLLPKYSSQFQGLASGFSSNGKIPCAGRPGTNDPCAPPRPPPTWSEWATAGQCSVTCGKGVRKRTRYCSGLKQEDCKGESTKEEPCQMDECNQWSEWTEWSLCSVTCGGGEKSRERNCRNGKDCVGSDKDTAECGQQDCPKWAAWAAWESCSSTCGPGTQQRHRECDPRGEDCTKGFSTEEKNCEQKPCPQWGQWQQWTECSKTCGGGERIRKRECMNGTEKDCPGPADEHLLCNTHNCPSWNEWSGWSQCSTTCGNEGSKLRQRECRYEGLPSTACSGPAQDQVACQQDPCPRWTKWSAWTPCTATCGHGQQQRIRDCEPRGYGCTGGDREIRFCQLSVCPYYDQWSEWGGCSVSCGIGTCERRRRCHKDDPLPGAVLTSEEELGAATGGGGALDSTERPEESNEKDESPKKDSSDDKPVSAKESNNSSDEDSQDSKKVELIERAKSKDKLKANQNKQLRLREHTLEVAQSSSTYVLDRRRSPIKAGLHSPFLDDEIGCAGPDMERKACDAGPCCDWSNWASWGTCQTRCGSGTRTRSRSCNIIPGSVSSFNSVSDSSFQSSSSVNSMQNNFRSTVSNNAIRPQRQVFLQNRYASPRFSNINTQYRPFATQYAINSGQSIMGCDCPGRAMEDEQCSAAIQGTDNCPSSFFRQKPQFDEHPTSSLSKCFWGAWAEWQKCSGTFSRGTRSRERECIKHSTDCSCAGEGLQTERCQPKDCNMVERDEMPQAVDSMKVFEENKENTNRTKQEEVDNDPVLSCYWSDWTEWSICGKDFLKQRTRLCVGLKALINNCECVGSSVQQTSCSFEKFHNKAFPKSTTPNSTTKQSPREVLRKRIDKMFTSEVEKAELVDNEEVLIQPNILSAQGTVNAASLTTLARPQFDDIIPKEETDNDRKEEMEKDNEICVWKNWTEWSECSAQQCGQEGDKIRHRTCACSLCAGGITQQSESCYRPGCPS